MTRSTNAEATYSLQQQLQAELDEALDNARFWEDMCCRTRERETQLQEQMKIDEAEALTSGGQDRGRCGAKFRGDAHQIYIHAYIYLHIYVGSMAWLELGTALGV